MQSLELISNQIKQVKEIIKRVDYYQKFYAYNIRNGYYHWVDDIFSADRFDNFYETNYITSSYLSEDKLRVMKIKITTNIEILN
jgi:hypothetical protein